ncbi:MAG: tetratricopeptide repeat protein [Promethearchaeota archaeon]|jgi:tetratricopeptide (TPR) repeat protein
MPGQNLEGQEESKIFILIHQFTNEGKFDKAFQLIKEYEEEEGRTLHEIVSIRHCKCEILAQQGSFGEAIKLGLENYKESLKLGKDIISVNILLTLSNNFIRHGNPDKGFEMILQGEKIFNTLRNLTQKDLMVIKAWVAFNKGVYYYYKEDISSALEYAEYSLTLREKLGIEINIARSLNLLSWIVGHLKGELDNGLKYAERGLALAKGTKNKEESAFAYHTLAMLNSFKGEVKRSITLERQALSIHKELNNRRGIASTLNSLGSTYKTNGDIDAALECVKRSLVITDETGNLIMKAANIDLLIEILVEKGDTERGWRCLKELEEIYEKLNDVFIKRVLLYDTAILLKTSSLAKNRVKAEDILKQLLEDNDLSFEHIVKILFNLCELLLFELRITNDREVLSELESYIDQLLINAEKSHSFWIMGETYLLQAKLALISLNLKEARKILIKGQEIAEKYNLNRLAIKISNEHDELLKRLSLWDRFKDTETAFADRIEVTRINEDIERMVRQRTIKQPELSEEDPLVVLIISKGGRPLFTQSFADDWAFPDHLIGGFLTAINSFSDEMFSEGLNRAIFGQHTILMSSIPPFLVCYLFKGQSYIAQQKLNYFAENIQKNKDLWETIIKFYQTDQEIQSNDIPILEPLIADIFINKNIPPDKRI